MLCWFCAFIFELPIDFSLCGCLFFSWVYMRLFMSTKSTPPNQIGDSTEAFALSTFFPERFKPTIDWLCKVGYMVFNMCRIIDAIQACMKTRKIARAKAKAENRKKALEMLQDEGDYLPALEHAVLLASLLFHDLELVDEHHGGLLLLIAVHQC